MSELFSRPDADDWAEDLYWAVRELMDFHGVTPSRIRRMTNDAIKGQPRSKDLRQRILSGGYQSLADAGAS